MLLREITVRLKEIQPSNPQYQLLLQELRKAVLSSTDEEFRESLDILQTEEHEIITRLHQIKAGKN